MGKWQKRGRCIIETQNGIWKNFEEGIVWALEWGLLSGIVRNPEHTSGSEHLYSPCPSASIWQVWKQPTYCLTLGDLQWCRLLWIREWCSLIFDLYGLWEKFCVCNGLFFPFTHLYPLPHLAACVWELCAQAAIYLLRLDATLMYYLGLVPNALQRTLPSRRCHWVEFFWKTAANLQ